MSTTIVNRPKDGPATTFFPDPMVTSLFSKEDDYFGLVLVTGWPPKQQMDKPYQSFLNSVRQCFNPSDLESSSVPNIYLYPPECLHVTIATLYPVEKKQPHLNDGYYNALKEKYVNFVKVASQRDQWPNANNAKVRLQLESVQLGAKAGIFLWQDPSNHINAMRKCLEDEATSSGIKIHIPNIIHSTFLRFANAPKYSGSGEEIQQKFQSIVVPGVQRIFDVDDVWDRTRCKLVCERRPYMHIPEDEEHVFLTIE